MSMRDEFEKWAKDHMARPDFSLSPDGPYYEDLSMQMAWRGWQAAREQGAEPVFWWDGDLSDLDGCVSNSQSAYHTIPLYTQSQNAGMSESLILRKQAEAVMDSKFLFGPETEARSILRGFELRLRQQADELERK